MSTTKTQSDTPRHVADLATERAKLDRTALIGIFGSDTAPGALVLLRSGKVARVGLGDRIEGGTVSAIGNGQLVLTKNGRAKVLKLPQA